MQKTFTILQNHFVRISAVTLLMLLIPLVAMQFSEDVDWRLNDFVIAGVLIFSTGLLYELIFRKIRTRRRQFIAAAALALLFLYIWAELAVGIFTNLGS